MKTTFIILFFCTLLAACGPKGKDATHQEEPTTEIQEKEFPKAACILWIDKNKE